MQDPLKSVPGIGGAVTGTLLGELSKLGTVDPLPDHRPMCCLESVVSTRTQSTNRFVLERLFYA